MTSTVLVFVILHHQTKHSAMKKSLILCTIAFMSMIMFNSCRNTASKTDSADDFDYNVDRFEDIRVLRYKLPAFENLSLQEKEFIYYLSEAALCGRDIQWDQNFKYNLLVRKTLEAILLSYKGDKDNDEYKAFVTYAKRVFFANGIHHHYSNDKFIPGFSREYFISLINSSEASLLPLSDGQTAEALTGILIPVMFDPILYAKKVDQSQGSDMITSSSVNFYEGVSQAEVETYYSGIVDPADLTPISYGQNTKVVKRNGKVEELTYKADGLYGQAIERIIFWLEKAKEVAMNEIQEKELALLIDYYRTGDLKTWDDYNIIWARNTTPSVDYINGFIETYNDPLGLKANWEAIVDYKDTEATKRTELITANAQWFEDNSPVNPSYRKETVTGVAASVINIAMLGGDCYPASPLGINLPNSNWIRTQSGSKSVTLANITDAIDIASRGGGMLQEFAADEDEIKRAMEYGSLASALHTDFHECIGHASGKMAPGKDANSLKNYYSPLEEARADLFALYYLMDEKVIELGLIPDHEAAKAEYDSFIRNGLLTQIVRIKPGKDIEQAHMRDRAAISHWVYEKGKADNVIEVFKRDGKTFVKINDYQKLRTLFGEMLAEIQRIKSEGDFEAGKAIIENYGVKIDQSLHTEVLERYAKLNLAPYTGFINPKLIPVTDANGMITDIKVEYCSDFLQQMLDYGRDYAYLPAIN